MSTDAQNKHLGADLKQADPKIYDIIQKVRDHVSGSLSGLSLMPL